MQRRKLKGKLSVADFLFITQKLQERLREISLDFALKTSNEISVVDMEQRKYQNVVGAILVLDRRRDISSEDEKKIRIPFASHCSCTKLHGCICFAY